MVSAVAAIALVVVSVSVIRSHVYLLKSQKWGQVLSVVK